MSEVAHETLEPGTVVGMEHGDRVVQGIIDTDGRFYTTDQSLRGLSALNVGVIRPLAVIDPQDRRQVQRVLVAFCRAAEITVSTIGGTDALQEVLTAMAERPKPLREWRAGDVVQGKERIFTAQRGRDGFWRTTSGDKGQKWGTDNYVTERVESGHLIVLREQAAGVNP